MRTLFLGLCLLLPFLSFAQEEIEFKEYSYSEFFQMLEAEEDSIFKLENAAIIYNNLSDSSFKGLLSGFENIQVYRTDTITIDKSIDLTNVHFLPLAKFLVSGVAEIGLINNFKFEKRVTLYNSSGFFVNSQFNDGIYIKHDHKIDLYYELLNEKFYRASNGYYYTEFYFIGNSVEKYVSVLLEDDTEPIGLTYLFKDNKFNVEGYSRLSFNKVRRLDVNGNRISSKDIFTLVFRNIEKIRFEKNHFLPIVSIELEFGPYDVVNITSNDFSNHVLLDSKGLSPSHNVSWKQWHNKVISDVNFAENFFVPNLDKDILEEGLSLEEAQSSKYVSAKIVEYKNQFIVENQTGHRNDIKFKSAFYNNYKSVHDTDNANLVYFEIKDLETQRLKFLYNQDPNFKTFFKWRINQFLKVFSAYGTEPERAIIFSVYVILCFAIIYLFFPNYWDSHGKNRIMDRYRFFLKYVNRDAGIHEVYLEEKKPDLLSSEDFKAYLQEQGKTAPKFFMATALPLYRWSIAGTRTASWLLSKVDVLKGKWSETEPSKQSGKSFLLITAFLIALTYDILIKMLNALMLSINTFTTLGFGEIPIKGLPRYLAIIQGFIGWFMLTIFSVALISQLLN